MSRFTLQLDVAAAGNLRLHRAAVLEVHLHVTTAGNREHRIARSHATHLDVAAAGNVAGYIVADNVREVNIARTRPTFTLRLSVSGGVFMRNSPLPAIFTSTRSVDDTIIFTSSAPDEGLNDVVSRSNVELFAFHLYSIMFKGGFRAFKLHVVAGSLGIDHVHAARLC